MSANQLIEIRVQRRIPGKTFPEAVGEFEFRIVPRIGEFIHLLTDNGDELLLRVQDVDHFAEAKPPFVSGADILLTCDSED